MKIKTGHIFIIIGIILVIFGLYRINTAIDPWEHDYLIKSYKSLVFIPISLIVGGIKQLNK
jgi:hypothetical protein